MVPSNLPPTDQAEDITESTVTPTILLNLKSRGTEAATVMSQSWRGTNNEFYDNSTLNNNHAAEAANSTEGLSSSSGGTGNVMQDLLGIYEKLTQTSSSRGTVSVEHNNVCETNNSMTTAGNKVALDHHHHAQQQPPYMALPGAADFFRVAGAAFFPPNTGPTLPVSSAHGSVGGESTASNGRTSRKPRKKVGESDGRWSKRFTWPEDLHRDFVSAIFDVGLKQSSPAAIMEFMTKNENITSERIKSHLQKYRIHRAKSKKEFMDSYDETVTKFQNGNFAPTTLTCGEPAAHMSYATINEPDVPVEKASSEVSAPVLSGDMKIQSSAAVAHTSATSHGPMNWPQLTEDEKKSPLGASFGCLFGLFLSLQQQLQERRSLKMIPNTVDMVNMAANIAAMEGQYARNVNADSNEINYVENSTTYPNTQKTHTTDDHTGSDSNSNNNNRVGEANNRSTRDEGNMLKRKMESQMAIQNKMRCIMQQELSKFKREQESAEKEQLQAHIDEPAYTDNRAIVAAPEENVQIEEYVTNDPPRKRSHSLSLAIDEEFWDPNLAGSDDEEVFEFLMHS